MGNDQEGLARLDGEPAAGGGLAHRAMVVPVGGGQRRRARIIGGGETVLTADDRMAQRVAREPRGARHRRRHEDLCEQRERIKNSSGQPVTHGDPSS